jgi:hypothetical protein
VERVSGSRSRERIDGSVLDARNHIQIVLESWSEVVMEGLEHPAPRRSVPHLTHFLATHLEWLADQPAAADFVTEIEDLTAEARRIVDPAPTGRSLPLGQCVVSGCAGTISTPARNPERVGVSTLGCSAGHSWEPHEWFVLRQLMRGGGG